MTKGLSEKERKQNKEYYKKRDAKWKPSEKDRENPNNKHLLSKEPKGVDCYADISANQLDGLKSWKVIKNHKKSRKIKNDGDERDKSTCECGGKHVKIENVFVYRPDEGICRGVSGEPVCNKCGKTGKREEEPITEVYGERREGDYGPPGSVRQLKTEKVQFNKMVNDAREQIARWVNLNTYSENFLIKDTLDTFKQARHLLKGRAFKPFTAACFYFVCRKNKIPITADSFFRQYDIEEKNVTDIFHLICNHLGEKLPLDKAEDKIRYVGKKVFMPEVLLRKASELIDRIPDSESGRSPTGIAAAALFLVSKDSEYAVTQKKLAEAVGIHKLTIGKSVKIVEKYWKND